MISKIEKLLTNLIHYTMKMKRLQMKKVASSDLFTLLIIRQQG